MRQVSITTKTGSSNTGMNGRTVAFAFLGSKRSGKQLGKYIVAPSKRDYTRRKTVFLCRSCSPIGLSNDHNTVGGLFYTFLKWTFYIFLFLFFLSIIAA
jgi:hypothetical protein